MAVEPGAAGGADPVARLHIEVVCSPGPRQVEQVQVALPPGATVADALQASGLLARHPALAQDPGLVAAVWGRAAAPEAPLRDGDRVALCRSLQVDPKEARRLRYRAQGQRRHAPRPRRAAGCAAGAEGTGSAATPAEG